MSHLIPPIILGGGYYHCQFTNVELETQIMDMHEGIRPNWAVGVLPLDHTFCRCLGSEYWKQKRTLRLICAFLRVPKC